MIREGSSISARRWHRATIDSKRSREFADGSRRRSGRKGPVAVDLRFPQVERFDKQYLPRFGTGRFLEIGGSCYVSAMVKSTYPGSTVYALDVSVTRSEQGKPGLRHVPEAARLLHGLCC